MEEEHIEPRRPRPARPAPATPARILVALVWALAATPVTLTAQEIGPPELVAFAGWFRHDYLGEGGAPFGALRFRLPMGRFVSVEPSVAHTGYTAHSARVSPGSSLDVSLVLLEFQVQGRLPVGSAVPYLGLGLGGAVDVRDDRGTDDFLMSTVSLAGGAAVQLGSRWSLRAEVRARGLDQLEHRAVEYGIGVALALGEPSR